MAIWYEVAKSNFGIKTFMDCNCGFHDYAIERAYYSAENNSAELFLKYDELEGSVIVRFLNVHDMHIVCKDNYGLPDPIQGSVLLLDDDQFLWIDNDKWGQHSSAHVDELKQENSWIQAERIIWAVTDQNGLPTEMPSYKIDQVWSIWGKTETRHFNLTPYKED